MQVPGEMINRWCACGRCILTVGQIADNASCSICQKEHANKFHEQFDIKAEEDKDGTTRWRDVE